MSYIPCLMVEGNNVAKTWEKSLLELWAYGGSIKTEYDGKKDPPSKDCTMIMVINKPMEEPRVHLGVPCGIEDLEKYRQELIFGIHDSWIKPEEGKWKYTYHKRLRNYGVVGDLSDSKNKSPFHAVDQIKYMTEKLTKTPHTRRAQAITWMPTADPKTNDPPCLQRVWCRISEDEAGVKHLDMNTHWRSRDAYKAAFMNIYAFTDLQEFIAKEVSEKRKEKISVGRYVDISDSYHIYGGYFKEFEHRFIRLIRERAFEKRTWRTDDPRVQKAIKNAEEEIAKERGAEHSKE